MKRGGQLTSLRAQRRKSEPLYASVARHLSDAIRSGAYPIGSLLPTEIELAEQFDSSRQTIREALRKLHTLGLVERKPGIGTWVRQAEASTLYTCSLASITDILKYAHESRLHIESIETVQARGDLAQSLECRDGTAWLHIQGTRSRVGDKLLFAVSEIYLRAIYPGIEKRLRKTHGAISSVLERHYNETVEEVHQEISSAAVFGDIARRLSVPPGSPALEMKRRFYGSAGRLLYCGHIYHAAERFTYSMRFRRDGEKK